jgi:hypothetical protein
MLDFSYFYEQIVLVVNSPFASYGNSVNIYCQWFRFQSVHPAPLNSPASIASARHPSSFRAVHDYSVDQCAQASVDSLTSIGSTRSQELIKCGRTLSSSPVSEASHRFTMFPSFLVCESLGVLVCYVEHKEQDASYVPLALTWLM